MTGVYRFHPKSPYGKAVLPREYRLKETAPDMSRAGVGFTHAEDAMLTALWRSGRAAKAICTEIRALAAELGRPVWEVCARIDFLMGPGAVTDGCLTPTERGLFVLAGRAHEDATVAGGFRLDGRQATARDVVTAANRVLLNLGKPAISYPGVS